jgi:hypothetical protein
LHNPQREIVFDPDQDLIKKPAQKADYRQKSLNHVGDSSVYRPAKGHGRVFEWLGWIEKHRVLAAWIAVALIVLLQGVRSWQATDRAGAKKHPRTFPCRRNLTKNHRQARPQRALTLPAAPDRASARLPGAWRDILAAMVGLLGAG